MPGQSNLLLVGLGATAGAVVVGMVLWCKKREKLPTEWEKVGEITDMMCYPIKSCAPIREKDMDCVNLGLKKGFLRDRVFMIIDTNGRFVTGRRYPKIVLIQPEIDGSILRLTTPGMMDVEIDIERLLQQKRMTAVVWEQKVQAIDCGEEAARWLSRYLLGEDTGLRLAYYPSSDARDMRGKMKRFTKILGSDTGGLPDFTSYLLISESSVGDLNTRLEKAVVPQNFRPNFVVKGADAFAEDTWDYIRIGNETIFRNVKICSRCLFTTVDPETGIKDSNEEPLRTLKKFRMDSDPERAKADNYSPLMGIHLGLRRAGVVRVGDPVYVSRLPTKN